MQWEKIFTVAVNETRIVLREKTLLLLLFVFLLMTLFSVYIGWSTKTTILGVYQASLASLIHSGVTNLPPNPFMDIPALSIFKNMIIYVFLIGSLAAIVIGHRAFIRERKSAVTLLIFSKPVSKKTYIAGKIVGIIISLFLIVSITFLINLFSTFIIPQQQLTMLEVAKLFSFYLVSLLYMLIFAMLGLFFAVILSNESLALFMPVVIWVAVTFIFPELITGQNPVALLNPVNIAQTTTQGTFFTTMQKVLFPISIEQHYTNLSQPLLEIQKQFRNLSLMEIAVRNGIFIFSLIFYFLLSLIGNLYGLNRYSAAKDKMHE